MKKSRILFVALLVLATLSFTSCLNDLEDHYGGFASSPALAELAEAPSAATGMISREIKDPTQPLTVNFKVNIATPKRLSSATTVTLAFDNTILDLYNAERGLTGDNALIPIPLDALTFNGYTVTIPGGELMTDWIITIDPTQVNDLVAKAYALPVKIVSADNGVGVSGNYGARIMRVLARNKYDGIYTVDGTYEDYVTATWSGKYPRTIHLITVSQYEVDRNDVPGYGVGFYRFLNGTADSYFGGFQLGFKFDADDNLIEVYNFAAEDANPNGRAAVLTDNPENEHKFNSVDHSIDVEFIFYQETVTLQNRGLITEHWTYVGPRP